MADLRFISADSHVQESDEFKLRVPAHFRERLPHMEIIDGGEYEIVEGRKPRRFDVAEARISEDDLNRNFREDPDGGRNIGRRLTDQRRDGVVGEVIYCNALLDVPRVSGHGVPDDRGSHLQRLGPRVVRGAPRQIRPSRHPPHSRRPSCRR